MKQRRRYAASCTLKKPSFHTLRTVHGTVGVTVYYWNKQACTQKHTCDNVPMNGVKTCHLAHWYNRQTRQNVNFLLTATVHGLLLYVHAHVHVF